MDDSQRPVEHSPERRKLPLIWTRRGEGESAFDECLSCLQHHPPGLRHREGCISIDPARIYPGPILEFELSKSPCPSVERMKANYDLLHYYAQSPIRSLTMDVPLPISWGTLRSATGDLWG